MLASYHSIKLRYFGYQNIPDQYFFNNFNLKFVFLKSKNKKKF